MASPPYLTPEALPEERICLSINIPNSREWLGMFDKILLSATLWYNWQQRPDSEITVDDTIAFWNTILAAFWDDGACATGGLIPTPFWDDAQDTDDEATAEEQDWYGVYDGDFAAQLADWTIAGFIAATGEIGGAIWFLTIAPKFRLAWRTGDVGGIVRVFIDGADYGTVDTYSEEPGVVEQDFIADPDEEEHTVLLVLEELHS